MNSTPQTRLPWYQFRLRTMLIYVTLIAVYFGIARPLGYEYPLGLAVICWIFWSIYRSIATMQETGNRNSYIPKLPLDNSTDATYPEP